MQRISGNLDGGLIVAARRLVEGALGLVPGERLVIVFDRAHEDIAQVLADVAIVAKATALPFRLDDLGARPHAHLHDVVAHAIAGAQASVLLIDFQEGELQMRAELVELAARHRLRHGHMVGVGRASLVAGFAVDPHRIAEKARALLVRLRPEARISVRSAAGTDIAVSLSPGGRWQEHGCIVPPGKRVNLPGGELVTSPDVVSGVYVANGTMGDADGALRRSLQNTPITLRLAQSRVQAVECAADPGLARSVSERIMRTANLDRVGLVGFGLNTGLSAPVGDIFTDQKVPGVHLSLGETFPDRTGAAWTSKSWIAFTSRDADVDIDKLPVLRGGRYVI